MYQPKGHHYNKNTRIKQNRSDGKFDIDVSAAIHIGSSFSCHCFCARDFPDGVFTPTWTNELFYLESKTKTALLFDENRKLHSFGGDAVRKYWELIEQKKDKEWYYFPKFKLKMDDKEEVTKDVMVKDINSKELPAILLMTEAIRCVKDHLLSVKIKYARKGTAESHVIPIHWAVAVPSAWNETSKLFMTQASILAGIPGSQLTVVKESDAAIQFCRHHFEKVFQDDFLSTIGNTIILLDAGGNTVNITTHVVGVDGTISEIGNRRMDALGGNTVNEKFLQMLIKIFGNPVLQRFQEKYPNEYIELLNNIENKKRNVDPSNVEDVRVQFNSALLNEICMEELDEPMLEAIESSTFKEDIQVTPRQLRVDQNAFKALFKETIDTIKQAVNDEIQSHAGSNLKAILMVGGFSECILLQEKIKMSFPDTKVIIPPQPMLATLIGSAYMCKQML